MASITATTTFLHDRDRFEEGETYQVADGLAVYFVTNGWASSDDVNAIVGTPPQEVTLEIQNAAHDTAASNVEG